MASRHLGELPLILRMPATRNSEELNVSNLAGEVGIPRRTLSPHLSLLETLYLVQHIPAWSTNLTKRAVSRPKVSLLDSGLAARLRHFRDRAGAEVDLVLEAADGRMVGIEVKTTSSPGVKDAKWLAMLRDRLGERFVQGIVLYTGKPAGSLGERISALPIDTLWSV